MQIAPGPIPADWLKGIEPLQKRIINHWTVTGYQGDEHCLDSYHFIIHGDGKIIRCNRDIDTPAPHTYGFNSAIGISICAMGGWDGRHTDYPPTKAQWDTMCAANKQLCDTYGIPVDSQHVLTHGEVTDVLGLDQWGKWDPGYLPHLGIGPETGAKVGAELRKTILTGGPTAEATVPVSVRLEGSAVVLVGMLQDANTLVPLRVFVDWAKTAGYKLELFHVDTTHKTFYLNDTNANTAERRDVLERGYVQFGEVGYAELKPMVQWLGLEISVETWTKDKRILVVSHDG
jgi:hypothetical protein